MNKYIKCAAVVAVGLVLTGCGGKKLTCSYSEESTFDGVKKKQLKYEFSKDGKNVEKYSQILSVKYTDKALEYYDEDLDDILEEVEDNCEKYDDVDFVTCKAELSGNKITQIITLNLKGLDEDDVEDMLDDDKIDRAIYEDVKDLLESSYEDLLKKSKDDEEELYKYDCR